MPGTFDARSGYYEAQWGHLLDSQPCYVICVAGATSLSQTIVVGGGSGEPQPNTNAAYGFFGAVADHALEAQRHMHLYGTTERQLGTLAVNQRAFANKRPEAQMHGRQ